MRHAPILSTLSLSAAVLLGGCFDARNELLDTTGAAAGSSTGASGAAGSTTGSRGTSSGSITGTGASSTSGTSSTGGMDAGPAANFCADLSNTLATLAPELAMCNIPVAVPTEAQCLGQAGNCSASDLAALQTFLICVDSLPMGGGCTSLFGPLLACTGPVQNIGCISLTGGTGGGTGSSSGGTGTGSTSGGFGRPDGGGPAMAGFCGPCARSRQCGTGNACILDGQNQQVCGQDCSAGQTCPTGSTCQMTNDVRMRATTQCVPTSCGPDGG